MLSFVAAFGCVVLAIPAVLIGAAAKTAGKKSLVYIIVPDCLEIFSAPYQGVESSIKL